MLKLPTIPTRRRFMGAGVVAAVCAVGVAASWAAQPPQVRSADAAAAFIGNEALTAADQAFLTMRGLEVDLKAQEAFYASGARGLDRAELRAFLDKQQADLVAMRRRFATQTPSPAALAGAEEIEAWGRAERAYNTAQDARFAAPPPVGDVRVVVFCKSAACDVRSVSKPETGEAKPYVEWAKGYAALQTRPGGVTHGLYGQGMLLKADLNSALIRQDPEVVASDPSPKPHLFVGTGPQGTPLYVVPPPSIN